MSKPCPTCKGTGNVMRNSVHAMHLNTCPTCHGTGEVKGDELALRDAISALRRQRDAHQMDEDEYVDGIVALIQQEVIAELEHKYVVNIDTFSSADYKAGFQDALDQVDRATQNRIAERRQTLSKYKEVK